jgi:hypothetical protein
MTTKFVDPAALIPAPMLPKSVKIKHLVIMVERNGDPPVEVKFTSGPHESTHVIREWMLEAVSDYTGHDPFEVLITEGLKGAFDKPLSEGHQKDMWDKFGLWWKASVLWN